MQFARSVPSTAAMGLQCQEPFASASLGCFGYMSLFILHVLSHLNAGSAINLRLISRQLCFKCSIAFSCFPSTASV